MKPIAVVTLAAALVLSACASPRDRIETRLVEAGFSQRSAGCIAEELTDRLSVGQLRRLSDVAKTVSSERRIRELTIGEFAQRVADIGDPEIVAAVTRAGLGCTILAR